MIRFCELRCVCTQCFQTVLCSLLVKFYSKVHKRFCQSVYMFKTNKMNLFDACFYCSSSSKGDFKWENNPCCSSNLLNVDKYVQVHSPCHTCAALTWTEKMTRLWWRKSGPPSTVSGLSRMCSSLTS